MKCDHALELLLEADLDELAGNGGSALAAHVRECAKCRAVAAQIATDTRALARAFDANRVVAPETSARRRFAVRPAVVVGAMAAAFAFIVFGLRQDGDVPPLAATGSTAATAARESSGTPVAPRRFAEPVPATPVRFAASQSVTVHAPAISDAGGVTVTPPEGTRVAVLRTGNPAITVVWLY